MLEIRKLTNKDLFKVIEMLSKIAGTAGRELSGMITSKKAEAPKNLIEKAEAEKQQEEMGLQIAMVIFETCFRHVQQDLIDWFASLCDMPTEEYLNLPPETTLQIMEQLTQAQEATSFFTRAWELSKLMKLLGSPSTEK
jgi:hypothetical protein